MTDRPDDAPPGVDVAAMRHRLLAERAALLGMSGAAAASRDPVALDQASVGRLSRMDAMQQQAMALATERRRVAALARIEAALARIDAGEFGWCIRCGEVIAPGRLALDAAAAAAACVGCAAG